MEEVPLETESNEEKKETTVAEEQQQIEKRNEEKFQFFQFDKPMFDMIAEDPERLVFEDLLGKVVDVEIEIGSSSPFCFN